MARRWSTALVELPERVGDGDRVLEGGLGHDVPRGDAQPEQLDHGLTGADRVVVTPPVDRGRGGGARQ
jgi:hypothetical protein